MIERTIKAGVGGVVMFGATVVDKDLAIPLGAAVTVGIFVWKASAVFKGLIQTINTMTDKLTEHDKRFDGIEKKVESLGSARILDMDILRSEMGVPCNETDCKHYASTLRVLIVDDDENDRVLFQRILKKSFECDTACSLAEATARQQVKSYDCVLLDLGLPDSHYDDAVKLFLDSNPGATCVALTGNEDPRLREMALAQGANGWMLKSNSNPEYLIRTIRNAILRKASK